MPEKEIELLQKQVDKLGQKDFDLEAWKNFTIVLLAKIFGEGNQKIRQIEKIEYDYSSWSLRDTSGYSSYLETCKKLGREILEAAIEELKNFGLPENKEVSKNKISIDIIRQSLEEEMKVSQYKLLMNILTQQQSGKELKEHIVKFFDDYEKEQIERILAGILCDPEVASNIG